MGRCGGGKDFSGVGRWCVFGTSFDFVGIKGGKQKIDFTRVYANLREFSTAVRTPCLCED
jgi:hypothetical protein